MKKILQWKVSSSPRMQYPTGNKTIAIQHTRIICLELWMSEKWRSHKWPPNAYVWSGEVTGAEFEDIAGCRCFVLRRLANVSARENQPSVQSHRNSAFRSRTLVGDDELCGELIFHPFSSLHRLLNSLFICNACYHGCRHDCEKVLLIGLCVWGTHNLRAVFNWKIGKIVMNLNSSQVKSM